MYHQTYPESAGGVSVPSTAYVTASAAVAAVAVGGGTHVYGALSLHIRNKHLQTVSGTVLEVLLVPLAVEQTDEPGASAVPESAAAGSC